MSFVSFVDVFTEPSETSELIENALDAGAGAGAGGGM
jgi:hypothetical protein